MKLPADLTFTVIEIDPYGLCKLEADGETHLMRLMDIEGDVKPGSVIYWNGEAYKVKD